MLRLTRFETKHDEAGGGVRWLLYEEGQQARPLRALSSFEVAALLDQVEAQRDPKAEPGGLTQTEIETVVGLEALAESSAPKHVKELCAAAVVIIRNGGRT